VGGWGWDVRLVEVSYSRRADGDGVTLELYGRTRDGLGVTVLWDGFEPYFHLVEPTADALDVLKRVPNYKRHEPVRLWYEGRDRSCVRVTVRYPWEVPRFRERMQAKNITVLAADIPFAMRFMYDLDLGSCLRVSGRPAPQEEARRYTSGLVVRADALENIPDFKPQLCIMSFDIENSLKEDDITKRVGTPGGRVLTICMAVRRPDGELVTEALADDDEERMLLAFLDAVERHDPDIITGYNIDGYDLPFVEGRLKGYGRAMTLGRDRQEMNRVNNRFWKAHGRIIADAWWNVKRELRPKRERLNDVAELVLGERKLEVDTSRIDEEWAADKDKVVRYCIQDAELALRILERIAVIEKNEDLATVSKLPLDDTINGRTSQLIDSIFIRVADRAGVGVPLTRRTGREGKIEGAYVHSLQAGLYNWIVVLDFKAMYPSIIIANNICFTTLDPKGTVETPLPDVRYLSQDVRKGLLPGILADLMGQRDTIKARMKAAKGDDERRYYDGLQQAVKILMNSFYGVFASSFYRFTNRKIGESITAFARENIKAVIHDIETEGLKVIYSDTDSVFVQSPHEGLAPNVEFGKALARTYTRQGGTLEFQSVLEVFFSHGVKKRYVGKVVWPSQEVLVRGYETRRTDAFDYQTQALEAVFELVLGGDIQGAIELSKQYVERVRRGEVEVGALSISRSVGEEQSYANPEGLAHVQAARKLKEAGEEFIPGMKVSYVVVQSPGKGRQEVEPYFSDRPFEHKVDYEYYARRVAASLARVTEVFDWDEAALLRGSRVTQANLFSGDFQAGEGERDRKRAEAQREGIKHPLVTKREEEPVRPKPKVTDKKLSLDDFF
jgi:DNA polymerase I